MHQPEDSHRAFVERAVEVARQYPYLDGPFRKETLALLERLECFLNGQLDSETLHKHYCKNVDYGTAIGVVAMSARREPTAALFLVCLEACNPKTTWARLNIFIRATAELVEEKLPDRARFFPSSNLIH
jgi:hypothetical protein